MSGSDPNDPSADEPQELDLDLDFDGGAVEPAASQKPSRPSAADEDGAEDDSGLDLNFGGNESDPAPTQAEPTASEASQAGQPDPADLGLGAPEPQPETGALEPQDEAQAVYGEAATSLDPTAAPATAPEDLEISDDAPEGAYERPEPVAALEGATVSASPEAWEEGALDEDSLGIEDIDFEAPVRRSNNRAVVIGAGLAGALAAAVLAIVNPGKRGLDPFEPGVASVPTPTPAAAPEPEPAEPAPADGSVQPGISAFDSDQPLNLLSPMGGDATSEYVQALTERSESFADLTDEVSDPGAPQATEEAAPEGKAALAKLLGGMFGGSTEDGPQAVEEAAPEPSSELAEQQDGGQDALRDSRTAQLDVMDQLLLPEDNTGIEFVQAGELEDIWMGDEIPPRGIDGRLVRLTPRVGAVRLITNLGEVFQGELYSIGAGEVSISNHLGRMTFSRRQIVDVVRMPAVTEALPLAASATGERVRVKVPGGWIYGRKLAEDRGRVVLLTDSGGRVTLPAKDIVPLGARAAAATPADNQDGIKQAVEDARQRQLEASKRRP